MNLKPERVYNRQFTVCGVDGWSVPAHSAIALFKVILVTAWDYWVFKRVGIQVAVIMSERIILNNLQITIHKSNRNKHIAKKLYFIELSKTLWHWVGKDKRGEFLPGTEHVFQNTFAVNLCDYNFNVLCDELKCNGLKLFKETLLSHLHPFASLNQLSR